MTNPPPQEERQCCACWRFFPRGAVIEHSFTYGGNKAEAGRVSRWHVCTGCDAKKPDAATVRAGDGTWYQKDANDGEFDF